MDFDILFKTSWKHFIKGIVDLVLFALVGMLLCCTIILIPTVLGGWTRGLLAYVREGKKPAFNELWSFAQFDSIFLLLFFGGILLMIGFILLFIPGLVLSVLWMYSLFFIVDKKMGFWQAMSASREAVMKDGFFQHLVVWIIAIILQSIGTALSGIGAIVTWPFILVFLTVIYLGEGRSKEKQAPSIPELRAEN